MCKPAEPRKKMAPKTLVENVMMVENGPSLMQGILDAFYPVGSIKFTVNNVNPGTAVGGTWIAWGAGRVPVGVSSDAEFNIAEKTGGEKAHVMAENEMPSHSHHINGVPAWDTQPWEAPTLVIPYKYISGTYYTPETESKGGGAAHNNLQPYITCYMWKRTA